MSSITSHPAIYLPLIGGVLIPFIVAALTKLHATGFEKSAIAIASAGLVALGTYVADVGNSHTWTGAASAFILALVAAASSRVTVTGGADTALARKTAGFGVGSTPQIGAPK